MDQKLKEIEQLKIQVSENVNNKTEYEKLKKCHKPLLKEYKIQIETIKNYETATEESRAEADQLNVMVADLNYALALAQESKSNAKTVLNNRIKHLNTEIQEINNELSAERTKVERFKKMEIIKPAEKLDESKKNMLEKVKFLEKSNAEKENQIAELSSQLVDRDSDLDKREKDADALKDALVKVEFWKEEAARKCQAMTELKVKITSMF